MRFEPKMRAALIKKYPGVDLVRILKAKIPRLGNCPWMFRDDDAEWVWINEIKEFIVILKH